jgi:hypothetical protein
MGFTTRQENAMPDAGCRMPVVGSRMDTCLPPDCSENLPKGVAWGVQIGMNGFEVAFRSRERTLFERHARRRKRAFAEKL